MIRLQVPEGEKKQEPEEKEISPFGAAIKYRFLNNYFLWI
jgi:hypothetical protein